MKNNVIIVAGGKGLRMGSELPKQFTPIGGRPVLMRTIEAFCNFDNDINKNVFGNNQLVITKISNSNHLKEKLKVFNERTRYRNTINLSKYYCY